MELKFNIDHKPSQLELLVNNTVELNSNEPGALKRQSVVHKHGNRTYSRDFLLSRCDQIRTGKIRVKRGATTYINIHQNHLCRRGKTGGVRLRSHLHKVRPLSSNHGNLVRIPITVNISKYQPDNLLRLVHFNAQSLKNKDGIIFEHITAHKINIAVVTESWLKDDDTELKHQTDQ